MKKLLFLLIFTSPLYAEGPKFQHKETYIQQEFDNAYQDIRRSLKHTRDLVINVKDFGAIGDGVTDDSSSAQAAIDSACTDGGSVYFPSGEYKLAIDISSCVVSIFGEKNGTKFVQVDTTTFMVTYIDSNIDDRRWINDIIFQGSGGTGRGVYMNNLGFVSVSGCRFEALEYGVYTNGVNWNHFFDCWWYDNTYGYITTTKNGDIIGRNPTLAANSAASVLVQCAFWYNDLAFYNDNEDAVFGDAQPAFSFVQCEFLVNGVAAAAFGGLIVYHSLLFDWCWFEQNESSGTGSFNGNTYNKGDIHLSGGSMMIKNIVFGAAKVTIENSARVVGSDIKQIDSTISISTNSNVRIDNFLSDTNAGKVFDNLFVTGMQPYRADRMGMALTTQKTAFQIGMSSKNVVNSVTSNCSFGSLPVTVSGSPMTQFVNNDGLYANRSVEILGHTDDTVYWAAVVTANKYYAISFSIKLGTTTNNGEISLLSAGASLFGQGNIKPTSQWKTFGGISQPSTSGSAFQYFVFNSTEALRVSCFQVVEFDSLIEAQAYLDSSSFALKMDEVRNHEHFDSAAPTSGDWNVGDITWNTAPTAGGTIGWVCTTAGSPGTWKTWGAITP